MSSVYDYVEAGFRVFGLYGGDKNGACLCGDPDCAAPYKHPVISNWQHTPDWSDDQLDTFEQIGHFRTGFGVLCSGYLVIDVDARNGGVESFARLCRDVPAIEDAGLVVLTGSGNGSRHVYFSMPEPAALVQSHHNYPGIDFKTSGYVVGAGSMHASGLCYEIERGSPQDVTPAPQALIDLLRKPEMYRVSHDGAALDVDESHIRALLEHIANNDVDYEAYIRVGMAIHHCLQGGGFDLWDDWCSRSAKNNSSSNQKKWHSFGKSANPAGYGTLLYYARQGGYCEPVTFEYEPQHDDGDEIDLTGVDLKRPPGWIGDLAQWINDQCLYPRETLSVAAALCAVSSLAGMRYIDETDDMSANMIAFCVAGSGTGKEAVQQAYLQVLRTAGVQSAVHGAFKSEQELMRNLIRHQAAFYSVDELGLVLRKLENASKRGGASYLEGIVGLIMSVYSKANGYLPITGDLKEEIREQLRKDLARAEKQLDDLPADSGSDLRRARLESSRDQVQDALRKIDDGLDSPYLTILGYTTPGTFDDLMGFEQATNGFLARAMLFSDPETNPKRKKGFSKRPMPDSLANAIRQLHAPGVYDMTEPAARVEFRGDKTSLPTEPAARAMLDQVYESFHAMADDQKEATGLEAIPRRGYELCAKASLILAMPSGVRTVEHVRWAYALARRDVERKIQLAYGTERQEEATGLAARVLSIVGHEHGETLGVICNRLRSTPKAQVQVLLQQMVDRGMLRVVESEHPKSGKPVFRYFSQE